MKTILYNPIFINPQAYYVFPRLTRWLRPDDSYKEPANYIGQIEVTIIAYGEIGYTEYFEHTNYIDFTNFSNSYVRISLFTRLGSCVLGEWKIGTMEGDRPYIEPEVLASLKAVVIVGDKTNQDKDRDIVANLVDASNPFIISNAAYEGMSGYNGYPVVFGANKTWENESNGYVTSITSNTIHITNVLNAGLALLYSYVKYNGNLQNIKEIPPFKIEIKGLEGRSKLIYKYLATSDATKDTNLYLENGTHELPKSFLPTEALINDAVVGFSISPIEEGVTNFLSDITIKVLPEYEGAFVTDGIDDLITSTKTVQEMGITDEVTVVSMIHQIDLNSTYTIATTNYIENSNSREHVRSDVYNYGKTGIYGYSASLINNTKSDIKNILGDEADYYVKSTNSLQTIFDAKFSVVGRISELTEASQVAWYWTIIANKVLTTDQINQVIAYFNLDRTLKPDILCNTIKQGITNENHAEFGDKLIDFSGNGRDIQLNNIAWNKESGIDDDGALRLDGVNDFGKVTGMPIYKDYTVVADYERLKIGHIEDKGTPAILSKSYTVGQGAFLMNLIGSTGKHMNAYTFGNANSAIFNDLSKKIYYQSKYKMQGFDMTIGSGVDGDSLWLGVARDNDSRFFNGAIYSLMSFPYSMSKFLIERQLKKHKLGTLYPDMVEWRPVIKSSVELASKPTFVIRGTSTLLNAGDYIPENSEIWVVITMNNAADRITKFVINGNTVDIPSSAYNPSTMKYGFPFTIDSKSPQKITMTIEQDENYVKFEPVITSNVEYVRLDFYLNNYQKKINIGDYIPKDVYIRANLYLKNNVDELTVFTFNGVNIGYRRNSVDDTAFNINQIYNYDSPQEVNITIDEYIRYEDIVQPYPLFFEFTDENGNLISWGGKAKVGSTITRTKGVDYANLLEGLFTITNPRLNGVPLSSSQHVVEKSMVFTCTATWAFDNNEPKCILSPRLLSIPNSSYKILGYIPDISGHGNHGVIHNSAYAEGSGVNEDGSYQFDGVDDFITIPTTVGGKQVLMKVNWQSIAGTAILYDQRTNGGFAIFNRDFDTNENKVPAYRARNIGGSTYIDGILNKYIYASELKNITHNIVELHDPKLNIGTLNPKIGSSYLNSNYTQMSLYDFMLFDEISTDEEILTLNEYVGIEGNTDDLFN